MDVHDTDILACEHHTAEIPHCLYDESDVSVHYIHQNNIDLRKSADADELSRLYYKRCPVVNNRKLRIQEE